MASSKEARPCQSRNKNSYADGNQDRDRKNKHWGGYDKYSKRVISSFLSLNMIFHRHIIVKWLDILIEYDDILIILNSSPIISSSIEKLNAGFGLKYQLIH